MRICTSWADRVNQQFFLKVFEQLRKRDISVRPDVAMQNYGSLSMAIRHVIMPSARRNFLLKKISQRCLDRRIPLICLRTTLKLNKSHKRNAFRVGIWHPSVCNEGIVGAANRSIPEVLRKPDTMCRRSPRAVFSRGSYQTYISFWI